MKKIERINIIMRYINNRAHFTISEIMQEFNISRSTAIRDIKEIESMGMPLVSEVGRSGGYFVMNNSFLPTIRFTNDEVKALFIAFMATRNQQLPYLKSRQSLAEKLVGLISETQQDDLVALNQMLLFEGSNPYNPDLLDLSDLPLPMLEKLIQMILLDRFLAVEIQTGNQLECFPIYIMHLYKEKSTWFVEGIHLINNKKQLFSVDDLIHVELYHPQKKINHNKLRDQFNRMEETPNLVVELGPSAILQFKKYSPFGLVLSYTSPYQTTGILQTYVNEKKQTVLTDMSNWLLFLGEDIIFKKIPHELLAVMKKRSY